jgi:hypothetical protein
MKRSLLLQIALIACFASPAFSQSGPTFHKDVQPILQKNCQGCHRAGEIAPMSLMTFQEVRPWAASIRKRVVDGTMPPWHADPHYGPFENDRRMTTRDIDTIVAWIDGGAKEGDPKTAPGPLNFTRGWTIGKPDIVLPMEQEYTIQPSGPDEYIYFVVKTNFTEDKWVKAAQIMPGNRKVVHHVLAYIQPGGSGTRSRSDLDRYNRAVGYPLFKTEGEAIRVTAEAPVHNDACDLQNGGSALSGDLTGGQRPVLLGYAPGSTPVSFPDGIGMKIPAGGEILFQIHYTRTGKPEKDITSLGLIFSKEPPATMMQTRWVQNYYFAIPPNSDNHEVKGCFTFANDVLVRSFFPHMHVRGKDMEFTAVYPDGKTATLMKVPNYDFSWQTTYILEKPIAIPKGTRIIVTAHFDNSKKNRFNPDPNSTVRWGDPTSDEMMIGGLGYTIQK